MNDVQEILNLKSHINGLEQALNRKRVKLSTDFQKQLDDLILKTPSGELRDKLTDLNILFGSIMQITPPY